MPRSTASPPGVGTGAAGTGAVPAGGAETGAGGSGGSSTLAHAASVPTIAAVQGLILMWLILLEALGALAILILIVWWTMFSGRKKGERAPDEEK
jgi:hypothetical protein